MRLQQLDSKRWAALGQQFGNGRSKLLRNVYQQGAGFRAPVRPNTHTPFKAVSRVMDVKEVLPFQHLVKDFGKVSKK